MKAIDGAFQFYLRSKMARLSQRERKHAFAVLCHCISYYVLSIVISMFFFLIKLVSRRLIYNIHLNANILDDDLMSSET